MKTDVAKTAGYLAFIVLGAVAINWLMDIAPFLLIPILALYLPVIVILLSDPVVYRVCLGYRFLGLVLLATAVWWLQIWILNLAFFVAALAVGFLDPDRRARSKRIRTGIRGLSHIA